VLSNDDNDPNPKKKKSPIIQRILNPGKVKSPKSWEPQPILWNCKKIQCPELWKSTVIKPWQWKNYPPQTAGEFFYAKVILLMHLLSSLKCCLICVYKKPWNKKRYGCIISKQWWISICKYWQISLSKNISFWMFNCLVQGGFVSDICIVKQWHTIQILRKQKLKSESAKTKIHYPKILSPTQENCRRIQCPNYENPL
jgi:hypothetical protein